MDRGSNGTGTGSSSSRNILFNKYEIGKLLGQGNFAKVYHGRNLNTNDSVAIKVIKKERLQKDKLVKQIKREVSVMRLVRHPHIVELKEVMANKAKIFLVVEYVKGGELFAKVAKGKMKEEIARKYFQQLISAVDFCHSRGVTHRDLKPENLLLDENEDLKVSDFGLSALPDQRRSDGMLVTPCGTPAYVAPEVLKKKGYDGSKADIWSCGVILFALLSGYLPFQGENVMRIYSKSFKADYAFPEWISPGARRMISSLLVVDPEKRYSIPDIMKDPWFQVGFMRPIAFSMKETALEDNIDFNGDDAGGSGGSGNVSGSEDGNSNGELVGAKPARPSYNAFEIISSLSNGFDLSNLFETRKRSPSMFISKHSASTVMAKLEALAKKLNFRVTGKKQFTVRMQGATEGRKGKLGMTVEVFEVAPEVAVVEFSKSAGDTLEYIKLCEEEVRPSLKDIVWSWQGDCDSRQ
ncbi:CBL-interacting serine/threonine-protein kinase 5-like [Vigna unguiculata]|uniref:non-specific serine/threonine protein kinase n=1 Tax=Vigna unguiculata TaxID=3917 RepID=A0A4D6N7J0_VIGUN|nr:CBL-interacting serine/threonine-protein kinase 5-like [Vigna unguiculata]QCE08831.1 Calcium/calmodulin-dependent/calcium-dependent protein kinase [Vigna unguiculata]QCE08832.1 Calcium/calmodulin-dependent/calcium-dependent protein kinase [Vigna unguiculata]